ncbi:hypothetical protein [Phenylobacterium sp.]|jgi:hypothetical protein|uniref:hypothetical protein n=1 Tax=Phenylobacterium sp. TaxID=1871053 RepID=UPI00120E600E|nr:hypothetical protein [Phenylobacterium sp.]THD72256.1 MAG: hypothetical protein E8A12_00775 [Phenylobacterium sp.]
MVSAVLAAAVVFMQAAAAGTPATTTDPSPPPAATASNSVSPLTVTGKTRQAVDLDPSAVVCHSETKLGSLLPIKICATRREVDERRQNDQQVARDFQRSVMVGKQPQ